jgi:hypothetical protein
MVHAFCGAASAKPKIGDDSHKGENRELVTGCATPGGWLLRSTALRYTLAGHLHVHDALKDEDRAMMQVARMAALVVGLAFMSSGSISAEAQQPKRGITLEDYMRMDRHGQTMYMVGVIEGFMTEVSPDSVDGS